METSKSTLNKVKEVFEIFSPYEGLNMDIFKNPQFWEPNKDGCELCDGGYKGRVGIYEVLIMSDAMKKGILSELPAMELEKIAKKEGMVSLEQDGIIKALQGITSLEEIYKLIKD